MNLMRTIHRWVGLILGIQLVIWMLSGLVMGLLPHERVAGEHYRNHLAVEPLLDPQTSVLDWTDPKWFELADEPVLSVNLQMFEERLVYRVVMANGVRLYDAQSGQVIPIDEDVARRRALADYSGPGKIVRVSQLDDPSLAIRAHDEPAWRVDFDDAESTSLYVAAGDGRVLERRNTYWRIFDVFWMLHIMDYQERTDFNNALVITAALILLWMGITGLVLWGDSFQREDFALLTKWRARTRRHTLNILDSEGGAHQTLSVRPMQTLFESMSSEGLPLPSTCGGGGTCGLCRVRIEPAMRISAADRRRIPLAELDLGYRLACQHRIGSDATVTLPHGLLEAKDFDGHVAETRFITPFICEIRVRLSGGKTMTFRAGSYVQMRIPPFRCRLDQLDVPAEVRRFWLDSKAPTEFGTDCELFRTYSISSAPGELDGDILLNVRMAMPKPDKLGVPVGIGSAYLASLKIGDPVTFKGPLGDFAVHGACQEMVFIGGGAGVGPLRSMILDQLENRKCAARISFWCGARTSADLLYRDLFEALDEKYANFSWHVALSEAQADDAWAGDKGLIHEVVKARYSNGHPNLSRCSFFVCGPPPMLAAVLEMLHEFGVPPERIAFDDFGI